MRILIICISFVLSLCSASAVYAQSWLWARSAGGSNPEQAWSVTTDASGNVYVAGIFASTSITFGATTLINGGTGATADVFLVKYNASGGVIWAKSAPGNGDDRVRSVTTDAAGNVYVTGNFNGTSITFGSTVLINSSGGSGGGTNMYLAKFDASGSALWARSAGFGAGYYDESNAVTTDAAGNVYITGYFCDPSITFGSTVLTNIAGGNQFFLVKYSPSGSVIWAKKAGGSGSAEPRALTADAFNHVYITGFYGTGSLPLVFGGTALTGGGGGEVFTVKYDTAGNALWAKTSIGTNFDMGYGIAADPSGDIYISGSFMGPTVKFGTTILTNAAGGSDDIFIAKYDSTGAVLWAHSAGGVNYDRANSLAADASGVYAAGYFGGPTVTFGTTVLTNAGTGGSADIFAVKYSTSGTALWAIRAGGVGYDSPFGMACDASSNIYVAGTYASTPMVFPPTTLLFAGGADMFVAKYGTGLGPISGAATMCVGDNNHLSSAGGGAWSSSNMAVGTIGSASGILTGLSVGTTVISYTLPDAIFVDTITVDPLPVIYTVGGSGVYTTTGTVTLSGSQTGTNYQLYDGTSAIGGPVPGTGSPLGFPVTVSATYFVVATNAMSCSDTMSGVATITITVTTGLSAVTQSGDVSVTPNPVKQLLTIKAPHIESIQIVDALGRVVINEHHAAGEVNVDLGKLVPGAYIVRVNDLYVQKVIRE